jgi:uncharacterized membrane-anchored protein YjiN (DUF445 family)
MIGTREENKDLLIAAKFLKMLSETQISETTSQLILAIIRDAKIQGKEQYYQTLSNLTDILNNSKTEEEIIQKLNEEYPIA